MFELKKNEEIGRYLSRLIKEKGYSSHRAFCKAYLEHEKRDTSDDEIRKMANRIAQITKGTKGIQIHDLPVITDLLDVTCEEILSAGESILMNHNRPTNYTIAFSNKEAEWESFINRNDKRILNPDEYGKTAIDYAIEYKNYGFLKYLVEKNYIWFDSGNDYDYVFTFGAGTSIKRREPVHIDDHFGYIMATKDQLRTDIVSLAIENEDSDMLDELRAREIPELYCRAHWLSCLHPDIEAHFDEKLVEHIANASNVIVNYFTESFEVRDHIKYNDGNSRTHTFMFPYISELLGLLVANKHDFTEIAIKKCIEHNNRTYKIVKKLINNAIENDLERKSFGDSAYRDNIKPQIIDGIFHNYDFYENGNIISFRDACSMNGIITNIIHAKAVSQDAKIGFLLNELNDSFERIVDVRKEFFS